MSHRILFISIALIFVVVAIMFRYKITNRPASVAPKITTALPIVPTTMTEKTVRFNNEQFAYAYFTVQNSADLTLLPNFLSKSGSNMLVDANGCLKAINGGFYDTSGNPLGYFFTDNKTYGKQIQSALLNGYFWEDSSGTAIISTALPSTAGRFALQTGPILLFNGKTMKLAIQNDEHARRMVAAKTADNHYVFLTVYSADSVFSGPLLSDLPKAVAEISSNENLGIADALNLDGGSASAFYNGDTKLSELTPVGSLFCIK